MKRFLTVSWLAAAAFSLACGGPTAPDLHGSVLLTFDVLASSSKHGSPDGRAASHR